MIRPEKMKQIEITVLERDVENVIKFIGRSGVLQFAYNNAIKREKTPEERVFSQKRAENIDKIKNCARYLAIYLPSEPAETTESATEAEDAALAPVIETISTLEKEEYEAGLEKSRVEDQLTALRGFENVSDSLSESDNFSFLNLKIGRLEPEKQAELSKNMGERAVVVPLGDESRSVIVASSKKGRFSLDSELKKQDFTPAELPQGLTSAPCDTIRGLESHLAEFPARFERINAKKTAYRDTFDRALRGLYASYLMADIIAGIKMRLVTTQNACVLSGWLPARSVPRFAMELEELTGGRIAISSLEAWEAPGVREGKEKIPVSLSHNRFAKSFEPLVFSYGAPLYGAIDPTPITAFFFMLLFAIMFGDVGQGLVLLVLGFLAGNKKIQFFKNYRHFAAPLKIIGPASMFTGFLYGSVFSNEEILHRPTELITGALAQTALGRFFNIQETGVILSLMPHGDNMKKIFYFFGFTIAIGIVLNSIGLVINIMNKLAMRQWEKAFFSKTGIAGLVFFWYAISLAVRALIMGGDFSLETIDALALALPIFFIVFGPLLWRLFTAQRPLLHEGLFAFAIEGIVEILETLSSYISNTVSFLRVGAFALSHAVLSFIIWTMAEKVNGVVLGSVWSAMIVIFGNIVIILLEGMIVAIQVTRLQYYEFFSKFFTETGAAFTPFRFVKKESVSKNKPGAE